MTPGEPAPDLPGATIPIERTLGGLLGIELDEIGSELATARFAVRERHLGAGREVQGGIYAALAEAVTSLATARAVAPEMVALGMANDTNVRARVTGGTVEVTARLRDRSQESWLWEAEFRDQRGRVCALTTMTVAVRPRDREDHRPSTAGER